ncbi:hypothetical protein [Pseudomonas sp. Irchel s3a10]|uniref:hypothetical protein n=1 Tax=Pseudomonas sp. Irchel s3a10 TaxID=2009045 RepID=UPI001179B6B7|nr:hypothetical protein [Pseudomonas sp. Irchel s3a10]
MDEVLKFELRKLLESASSKIDRDSFSQEPHYTSALFGKLHGEKVLNKEGRYIKLSCSPSNDRGRGSAESKTGIDVGMVFEWEGVDGKIFEKAIMLQAKNNVETLNSQERKDLEAQCEKMAVITKSYLVMDCPYDCSVPNVYCPDTAPPFWKRPPFSLTDYLIDQVFPCTRGDSDAKVVSMARRSDRCLVVTTNLPKPKVKLVRKNTP